jgi:hypothetical protein
MPARKTKRRKNPVKSGAQFRLAEAVAHGRARATSMSKKVAKELLKKTPKALRSKFAKSNHRRRNAPKMYVTATEAKKLGLPSNQEQIDRYNAAIKAARESEAAKKKKNAGRIRDLKKAAAIRERRSGPGSFMASMMREKAKHYKKVGKATRAAKKARRNPAKRNPEESAVAAYREFHGKEPTVDTIIDTPRHFHAVLAGMARLVEFDVKRAYDGGTTTIKFDRNTYLTESEKKDQIFISGGDQSVNLKDFGIFKPHEFEVLGTILSVTYYTEKKHLIEKDGGKGLYKHPFKAPRPTLIYDVRSKLLTIAGGGYTIPSEGIDG